jgi:hypothetical protein
LAGGFLGWLFNTGYEDGYDAGTEWSKQSSESAPGDTMEDIRLEHGPQWDQEEFYTGWRNAERDSEHGFLWKLFHGG